jgi:glycosyltransferase involved in cell wall biosynthesis
MNRTSSAPDLPRLVWIYPGDLNIALDATTWLATTRELRNLGWYVTLIAAGQAGQGYVQGVEVHCIAGPQVYLVRQLVFHARLLSYLARDYQQADIILFHPISALWLLCLRLLYCVFRRQRPLFVMDTRTVPMSSTTWKERVSALFCEIMNRLAKYWVDGQTAITPRMAETVGIPARQLWGIWPSGVDPVRFAPAQAMREWPDEGEPVHLIYVGRLDRERNLLALCHAVISANDEGKRIVLSLVGTGSVQTELEWFAQQTKGQIHVVPPIPHEQVPALLAQAHVGVLPFPDEERFRVSSPIKLFEYMAAGLPILATRVVCHSDVLGNGAYVFWAETADMEGLLAAIRTLWQHRTALAAMGCEAAGASQSWTWRAATQKLSNALKTGLAEKQETFNHIAPHRWSDAP